jgi:hypothetical protein
MFKSHTSNLRTDATTVARRVREEKESEEKELGKRVSRKEDHSSKAREKAEKYETLCFPKFCGSGGSKAGSLKRRTQSHLVARHCGAKRTSASQRFLGSQLLNKVRASVARSRFPSPNAKKTPQPRSTHWKLSCQETAGDCKTCTWRWREANFQVELSEAHQIRTTFGRSSVIFVAGARDFAPC